MSKRHIKDPKILIMPMHETVLGFLRHILAKLQTIESFIIPILNMFPFKILKKAKNVVKIEVAEENFHTQEVLELVQIKSWLGRPNNMWFFGFSTTYHRNLWTIGAILFVIIVTLLLRKILVPHEAEGAHDLHVKREGDEQYHETLKSIAIVRTYALEELRMATRGFSVQIGVGATSKVYLAELGDGRFGAVKRVMEERGGSKKVFLDEVSVLLRISHQNLVGLIGFCLEKGEQLLLLEYVPNKSLFERMHTYDGQRSGILSWASRWSIALDIGRALDYLHFQADPPIIHRDVKSSNILLIDDMHAKLADFGLCKLGCDKNGPQTPTTVKGSFGNIDPHYLQTGIVSIKSDVYSFGVLLLELITGLKSTQGSVTLAEWAYEYRKNEDIEVMAKILDPKLKGAANLEQLRVLISLANAALLEDCEARPDMSHIVDRISRCM